ncbi:MAG: ABC transporter permease [Pirellulales bacterium]
MSESLDKPSVKSPGFWAEAGVHFLKNPRAMLALFFVLCLGLIALSAPMLVGTKPIVCKYKGNLYFPAMGYYKSSWENPIFYKDKFRRVYPGNLKKKDPESWAWFPPLYQDPYRRVRDGEYRDQPGNKTGVEGTPNQYNKLGTDTRGVDVLAQMIHGTQIALMVGFVSMGIASVIGVFVGACAGFFGGWVDILLSRLIEIVICVPSLVLILAMLAILDQVTIWHLMAIIGFTGWTGIARLTRAEFLKIKQLEYVTAAKALGAGSMRVMFIHILRNSMAPILVPISFGIASAILTESALSFLGFGAPPPNPSWGTLLSQGRANIQDMWWLIVYPGLAIFLTVLAYNLIGEGIQDATDPRTREAK